MTRTLQGGGSVALRVGVFINSAFFPHAAVRPTVEAAGRRLGLALTYVEVRSSEDVDDAFAAIARENLGIGILSQRIR